jgi:Skp family chaperone for outer membrane proteins
MKRISYIAVSIIFAAIFAVSGSAQATAQPAGSPRMAVIDTRFFEATGGITRYINAMNALEAEFKPLQTELQGMETKRVALAGEIKKLQDTAASGGTVPISEAAIRAKVDEYQTLEVNMKRKKEDAERRVGLRSNAVVGPVQEEIGKALQDFATQKGYDLILNLAKLDESAMILAFNPAKADVTKEFIAFFNARPATAATAAAPR